MTNNRTFCPSCAASVSERTLDRFGGVCRRCHKQPIAYRVQWIALAMFALATPVAAILMDQELASLEASGGTRRVHVLVATCYRFAGRTGVMIFFAAACCVASVLSVRAFRNAKAAKRRVAEAQRKADSLQ